MKPQLKLAVPALVGLIAAFAVLADRNQVYAQVGVPPVDRTLNKTINGRLSPVPDLMEQRIRERAARATGEAADTLVDPLLENTSGVVQHALESGSRVLRKLVTISDPLDLPVEKDVLLVLAREDQIAAISASGLRVLEQRELPGLGRILLTLQATGAQALSQSATELMLSAPQAVVDYNHLYRLAAEGAPDLPAREDIAVPAKSSEADTSMLRIGLIDSSVKADHEALSGSEIISADFVSHEGNRPAEHGTAVASILAAASPQGARIHAASVFFQPTAADTPVATTQSLVEALDWLASQPVDVINISLAGPPNALLQAAVLELMGSGLVVVAAVGNQGPSAEPQYPAAFQDVIGVTAVDEQQRVYRYANRGSSVDFAALGVSVRVADSAGDWRLDSGTSMAAPLVAAIVAQAQLQHRQPLLNLLESMTAVAVDLGQPGQDEIFGFGLLSQPPVIASRIRMPSSD